MTLVFNQEVIEILFFQIQRKDGSKNAPILNVLNGVKSFGLKLIKKNIYQNTFFFTNLHFYLYLCLLKCPLSLSITWILHKSLNYSIFFWVNVKSPPHMVLVLDGSSEHIVLLWKSFIFVTAVEPDKCLKQIKLRFSRAQLFLIYHLIWVPSPPPPSMKHETIKFFHYCDWKWINA